MAPPMDHDAVESLCDRAAAGPVASGAQLLVATPNKNETRAGGIQIKPTFRAAVRKATLRSNWTKTATSAFVTSPKRRQAIGVSLGLGGVLEMPPVEQRAPIARRLPVDGNPAWMPARAASGFVVRAPGIINARTSILERAQLDLVIG